MRAGILVAIGGWVAVGAGCESILGIDDHVLAVHDAAVGDAANGREAASKEESDSAASDPTASDSAASDSASSDSASGDSASSDSAASDSGPNDATATDHAAPASGDASAADAPADGLASCPLGASNGRCLQFVPTVGAQTTDLDGTGLLDFSAASGDTIVNTDTGQITHASSTLRASNSNSSAREVISGIAYRQDASGISVFSFKSLTIASGATLRLVGLHAVSLVSSGFISVDGVVEGRPMDGTGTVCASLTAGPGGYAGGAPATEVPAASATNGSGPGGGGGGPGEAIVGNGGSGGGHAAKGGGCSTGCLAVPSCGPLGAAYDGPTLTTFRGGSGGGGAGGGGGDGGGGGGAVQLIAAGTVTIGSSASSAAGVDVGGCGGKSNGGGGGSGGAILIEAPHVQLGAHAVLAANGGAGGSSGQDGANASFDDQCACAFPGFGCCLSASGNGGAKTTLAGGAGAAFSASSPDGGCGGNITDDGDGGGGAVGFIRINTLDGTLLQSGTAIISPSASGASSTGPIQRQ